MTSIVDSQVLYLGRWVSREHFRAFVYNSCEQKIANSYKEFSDLISSGVWFAEKKDVPAMNQIENVVSIKRKRGRKCQNLNNQ